MKTLLAIAAFTLFLAINAIQAVSEILVLHAL
jgi:hypothetical protein